MLATTACRLARGLRGARIGRLGAARALATGASRPLGAWSLGGLGPARPAPMLDDDSLSPAQLEAALLAEIDEAVRAANEAVALDESVAAMQMLAIVGRLPGGDDGGGSGAPAPAPAGGGDAAPPAAALELPGAAPPAEGLQAKGKKGWRTYQPSVISRKRTHGFLRRMKHHSGRNTIRRRQRHGRWRVSVT